MAGEAHRQCSPEPHCGSPPSGKHDGDKEGEVLARDFGKGLIDGPLLIAGTGWIISIKYNALLWVKVIEVGYLCAGSLADYPSVIAK